jgi:hypothetical protein
LGLAAPIALVLALVLPVQCLVLVPGLVFQVVVGVSQKEGGSFLHLQGRLCLSSLDVVRRFVPNFVPDFVLDVVAFVPSGFVLGFVPDIVPEGVVDFVLGFVPGFVLASLPDFVPDGVLDFVPSFVPVLEFVPEFVLAVPSLPHLLLHPVLHPPSRYSRIHLRALLPLLFLPPRLPPPLLLGHKIRYATVKLLYHFGNL